MAEDARYNSRSLSVSFQKNSSNQQIDGEPETSTISYEWRMSTETVRNL